MTIARRYLVGAVSLAVVGCTEFEPYEVEYDVVCPTEEVVLTYVGFEEGYAVFGATIGFAGCTAIPADYQIVRIEGGPASDFDLVAGRDSRILDMDVRTLPVPVYPSGDSYYRILSDTGLIASGMVSTDYSGEYYLGFDVASEEDAESFESVSIEFTYDCACEPSFDSRTNQTFDHESLDLLFDTASIPTGVVTNPPSPMRLTPFEIRWSACYDYSPCMDQKGWTGEFNAFWRIDEVGGGPVDSGWVTLPSVSIGDCQEVVVPYDDGLGLGEFIITVELDYAGQVTECPESPENNVAYYQFETVDCTCPPSLGDLSVREFEVPSLLFVGDRLSVAWEVCYSQICGSYLGATDSFTIRLVIEGADGSVVETLDVEQSSLTIGECDEGWIEASTILVPGDYTVRIELDPDHTVSECEWAVPDDHIASRSLRVAIDPELGGELELGG